MVDVIAHRGLRDEFPENTLASIDEAIKLPKLKGVEFDIELSLDEISVVLHQETMIPDSNFRTLQTATRDFEDRDWVGENKASKIVQLDAGSWKGSEFSNLRVPLLSDVLNLNWQDKEMCIELKDPTYWSSKNENHPPAIVNSVIPFLEKIGRNFSIISFNPKILEEFKNRPVKPTLVFALWYEWQDRISEVIEVAKEASVDVISLADQMLLAKPNWIEEIHKAGMKIHVYPVSPAFDEPEYKNWNAQVREPVWRELIDLNVDAIVSDFPRELLAFIE